MAISQPANLAPYNYGGFDPSNNSTRNELWAWQNANLPKWTGGVDETGRTPDWAIDRYSPESLNRAINFNAYNIEPLKAGIASFQQTMGNPAMLSQWQANHPGKDPNAWLAKRQAQLAGYQSQLGAGNYGTTPDMYWGSSAPTGSGGTPTGGGSTPGTSAGMGGSDFTTGATSLPPYTFGSNDGYQFGQQPNYFDPGYAFRLKQGSDLLQGSAAARGGLLSGPTLKALNDYGQASASQEFNNAYNRFTGDRAFNYGVDTGDRDFAYNAQQNDRNFNYQTLRDLTNWGMQGTQGQDATSRLLATLLSQNALASGQTGAAGTIGGSNQFNAIISQLLNYYQGQDALNRAFG